MLNRRTFLSVGAAAAVATGITGTAWATRGNGGSFWDSLRGGLTGDLVLPSDNTYEQAKKLAAAQFDQINPQAIAYCENEADVALCLRFAQDHHLHTAIRSGGHSFVGWSTTRGLVVDLSRMNRIQPAGSTVHLGPGAQAVDVVNALSPLGLTIPAGFCPTVCPGGFITGGGMGWQFRKYGPASDRLRSARVVLADGRTVTASKDSHPDLFWALRGGGGGNFGVVTDFELAPTKEPTLVNFTLNWPFAKAATVLNQWQGWADRAPAHFAPRAGLLLNDAAPGNEPKVIVTGVHFGSLEEANKLLDELVGLIGSAPVNRSVAVQSYQKAMMTQFGCDNSTVEQCHLTGTNPEALLPRTQFVTHRSRMFDKTIPAGGVEKMVAAYDANRTAGQYRWLGFLSLGKNANKVPAGATAYVHRSANLFAVYTVGLSTPFPPADQKATALGWVNNAFNSMDPYSNGHTYVNYPDQSLPNWQEAYYGQNQSRLVAVKRQYDPHCFFTFPQSIRP